MPKPSPWSKNTLMTEKEPHKREEPLDSVVMQKEESADKTPYKSPREKNTYKTNDQILNTIDDDFSLIQKEKEYLNKIIHRQIKQSPSTNMTNGLLDDFSDTIKRLDQLFIKWINLQDREFMEALSNFHKALAERTVLSEDDYQLEVGRARKMIAALYLKSLFNPNLDIQKNPMGYDIPELLKICRFVERRYWSKDWNINWKQYHDDYFKWEVQYLPTALKQYNKQNILEDQLPLFIAIFDKKNTYSMLVFDDIMLKILWYTEKEFLEIIRYHNLVDANI